MSDPRWRLGERFDLLDQIGAGVAGTVWRARDARTGTEHAVKVLRPELVADPDAVTELYATLDSIARLRHPGIVAVDDAAAGDGWFALRSVLIPGGNLRSPLSRPSTMAPASAVLLIADLCDALAPAHAAGIAHGNVHPGNVLLVPGVDALPRVGLTDFGMAALINRAAARGFGNTAPPAAYRAPELAPAQPATAAADVYAAGVLLHEIIAGHPLAASLGPSLAACLERDPRYRPTAAQLAGALRNAAAAAGTAGLPAGGPIRPSPHDPTTRLPPVPATSDAENTRLLPGLSSTVADPVAPDQYGGGHEGGRLPSLIRAHKAESGIALAVVLVAALVAVAVAVRGGGSAGAAAAPVTATAPPATSATAQAIVLPPAPSTAASASASPSTTPSASAQITLVNARSGSCLDTAGRIFANGTTEDIWSCNSTPAQIWTLTPAGQLTQDGGAYCLDDTGFGTAPGTKVVLWRCNGGANQQWTIQPGGSVIGAYSHLCLDVAGQGTADGTALYLWTCDGQPSQQWSQR